MRIPAFARMLLAVLYFQLGIGLPLQAAHAEADFGGRSAQHSTHHPANASDHCPMHDNASGNGASGPVHHPAGARDQGATGLGTTNQVGRHAAGSHSGSFGSGVKHDCCQNTGCWCQCAYTAALFVLPMLANANATPVLLPHRDAVIATARTDDHFRPPIP